MKVSCSPGVCPDMPTTALDSPLRDAAVISEETPQHLVLSSHRVEQQVVWTKGSKAGEDASRASRVALRCEHAVWPFCAVNTENANTRLVLT